MAETPGRVTDKLLTEMTVTSAVAGLRTAMEGAKLFPGTRVEHAFSDRSARHTDFFNGALPLRRFLEPDSGDNSFTASQRRIEMAIIRTILGGNAGFLDIPPSQLQEDDNAEDNSFRWFPEQDRFEMRLRTTLNDLYYHVRALSDVTHPIPTLRTDKVVITHMLSTNKKYPLTF